MGGNGNSQMGIPWEWESVTKMGMGIGRNGKIINGNGWEWERIKQILHFSNTGTSLVGLKSYRHFFLADCHTGMQSLNVVS